MDDRQLFPWMGVNNGAGCWPGAVRPGGAWGAGWLAGFHQERGRGEPVTGVERVRGVQTGSAG